MLKTVLAVVFVCLFSVNADARERHKATGLHPDCGVTMPCVAPYASTPDQARVTRGRYIAREMGFGAAIEKRAVRAPKERQAVSYGAPSPSIGYTVTQAVSQVIGGRPSGCPHQYCGCSASLQVFGKIVPALNLAANWLQFPRTAPAPGMVAARRGHVFVLKEHLGGNVWMAHDGNSGRHLTRLHPRSIIGYVIVDPHGSA